MCKKNRFLSVALVSAIFAQTFLSGCQQTLRLSAPIPDSLNGLWQVGGTSGDYKTVEFLDGQEFKIDRDGDGQPDILGYYTLDGAQIIFSDKGGIIIPACHRQGVYIPKLEGNQLSFELVSDECPGRLAAMKHAWQRAA